MMEFRSNNDNEEGASPSLSSSLLASLSFWQARSTSSSIMAATATTPFVGSSSMGDSQHDAQQSHRRLDENGGNYHRQQQQQQQQQEEEDETSVCAINKRLDTDLNTNPNVPPFVGMMFTVMSALRSPGTTLAITSLELDVRSDRMTSSTEEDRYVEVYVFHGEYRYRQQMPSSSSSQKKNSNTIAGSESENENELHTNPATSKELISSSTEKKVPNDGNDDADHLDHLSYENDPTKWEQVFKGSGVFTSTGTSDNLLTLPARDFSPIRMGTNDRISLYITMKKPLLDHTVHALDKTGEIARSSSARAGGEGDLNLLVGSGLSAYHFPRHIDPIVDPQFAGTIHYTKQSDSKSCNLGELLLERTTVEYAFNFDKKLASTQAGNSLIEGAMIGDAVNEQVDNVLRQHFVAASSGLVQNADSEHPNYYQQQLVEQLGYPSTETTSHTDEDCYSSYGGNYQKCTKYSFLTRVDIQHKRGMMNDERVFPSSTSSASSLLNSLYSPVITTMITKSIQESILVDRDDHASIYYIGLNSVAAKFEVTLEGVSPLTFTSSLKNDDGTSTTANMDSILESYFRLTTESFLGHVIDSELATNFEVVVVKQHVVATVNSNHHRLSAMRSHQASRSSSTLKVAGVIRASRTASLDVSEFDNTVAEAFRKHAWLYRRMLVDEAGVQPGPILEDDRYQYFSNVTHVSSWLAPATDNDIGVVATPSIGADMSSDEKLDGIILVIATSVGVAAFCALLFVALLYLRRHLQARAEYKLQLANYRKERREKELKLRRQQRAHRTLLMQHQTERHCAAVCPPLDGEDTTSSSFTENSNV